MGILPILTDVEDLFLIHSSFSFGFFQRSYGGRRCVGNNVKNIYEM